MKLDTTLYLVTDSTGMTDEAFLQTVCAALKGGVTLLQLREKERSAREYLALAEKVLPLAHEYGVPLLIDDRIDVAIAAGADGAHVGQNDIPVSDARRMLGKGKIVGATAKTPEQAIAAFPARRGLYWRGRRLSNRHEDGYLAHISQNHPWNCLRRADSGQRDRWAEQGKSWYFV